MSLYKWKILVTPKEACESLGLLPSSLLEHFILELTGGCLLDSRDLIEHLKDKDGVILDVEPITTEILKWCPNLKVISRFGEGYDAIDLEATKQYGVKVARTLGTSSKAVAQYTISLIFAMLNRIVDNDRNLKQGLWVRQPHESISNMTLGILGFGKIGQEVAEVASLLGFKIIVHSRHLSSNTPYKKLESLEELILESNIVSLHLPLNIETKNIISKSILSKLKGKYLINTARGRLIDEKALLEALEKGDLLGYATDVFASEPIIEISKKIAMHPRVICSPHVAALDPFTMLSTTKRALYNILFMLQKKYAEVNSFVV